jgi:serine/threonine-protein kinase
MESAGVSFSEQPQRFEVLRRLRGDRDTGVFLLRRLDGGSAISAAAVLKIYRTDDPGVGSLDTEARLLSELGEPGESLRVPRLLGRGELEGWPYLLLEWLPGVSVSVAAAEARRSGPARALRLCVAIARAYDQLHGRGWLHGDVHPGNIRVDGRGRVYLLDLALARRREAPEGVGRRPMAPLYMEPEHARSLLDGHGARLPSEKGEQLILASVLYEVMTGSLYHPFSLEREALLREVVEAEPRAFVELGQEPWPELEAVLARALERQPAERWPSMADFAAALGAVEIPADGALSPGRVACRQTTALAGIVDEVSAAIGPQGHLWGGPGSADDGLLPGMSDGRPLPRASLKLGAAGLAYACLRLAAQRRDGELLAWAELWTARAASLLEDDGAFYPGGPWTREKLGTRGPFYGRAGVAYVQALLAVALGDTGPGKTGGLGRAVRHFVEGVGGEGAMPTASSIGVSGPHDLTLGTAGALMAASHLLALDPPAEAAERLRAWAGPVVAAFEEAMGSTTGPADPETLLGIAHGWGGQLLALLQWHGAAGSRPAEIVERRLGELAGQAEPHGRGVRWPWVRHARPGPMNGGYMGGWCNGGAGLVFLGSAAARVLGDERWLGLAERAALGAMEGRSESDGLCCGTVGRAYAALHLHGLATSGADVGSAEDWLDRAHDLARQAAERRRFEPYPLHCLYRGELGLALLAADLERPEAAIFPCFEPLPW